MGRRIRIDRPQHVKRLITELVNELRQADPRQIEPEKRARLLTQLYGVALAALRESEFERRLTVLENRAKERRPGL